MRISLYRAVFAALLWCLAAQFGAAADVSQWIENLNSGSAAARHEAADQLAKHPQPAEAAVEALTKALDSDDAGLRWRAARALGAIGSGAKDAVSALTTQLGDTDPQCRAYAAYALGRIGEASKPAAAALIQRVTDPHALVRRAAIQAIHRVQPDREMVLPVLVKVLEEAEPAVLFPALQSLAKGQEKGVPGLIHALRNDKACYWACLVAQEIGPDAAPAVPALIEVLDKEEPEVRMHAVMALGQIGPNAASAVPAIATRLDEDKQDGVRYAAAYALGKIKAKGAESALRKALASDDEFLRLQSAFALAQIHPQDKELSMQAVELIVAGLKSKNPHVRRGAAQALTEIDAPSEIVAPAMIAAIDDADPEILADVIQVLSEQGAKAVPRLIRGLSNETLRFYACQILARIGPEAKDAVPALIAALDSKDPAFRREAHYALAAIGPDAAAAVPVLVQALAAENDRVRYSACFALGKIGPAAKDATDALREGLSSEDEFTQIASSWAMLHIHPDDPQIAKAAVPLMIKALADENPLTRREAARTLGSIGPPAASAIAKLEKLLNDPNQDVRQAAVAALARIRS